MKKLLLIGAIAFSLGACAQIQTLTAIATSSVTPTQALVAANAFDAAESGATGYLVYCKSNPTSTSCTQSTEQSVIRYVRAGRAARNQLETYIQTSATIPSVVYNSLVAAVNNLKASPAANYVGAK